MADLENNSDLPVISSQVAARIAENLKEDPIEFPIPTVAFVKTLAGTPNEIFGRLLRLDHAGEARTVSDWHKVLVSMKQREA